MKAIAAAFILMMSSGMDCNSPTGSSGSTRTSGGSRSYNSSTEGFNGWVTNAVSHDYIEGASVCVEASSRCTTSGSGGGYHLTPDKLGTFTIVTTHPDYRPETHPTWCAWNNSISQARNAQA